MNTPPLYGFDFAADGPLSDSNFEAFPRASSAILMPAKLPSFSFYPEALLGGNAGDAGSPRDREFIADTIPQVDFSPDEEIANFDDPFDFLQHEGTCQNMGWEPHQKKLHTAEDDFCLFNESHAAKGTSLPREPASQKDFHSKAVRNIKSNFGTGLIQFLEFRKELAEFQKQDAEALTCRKLLGFLRSRASAFVSFAGWKDVLTDELHGKALRRKAREFFGKSFARTYVQFGKIREEYKPVYYRKIRCFFEGAKNPHALNPASFNKY